LRAPRYTVSGPTAMERVIWRSRLILIDRRQPVFQSERTRIGNLRLDSALPAPRGAASPNSPPANKTGEPGSGMVLALRYSTPPSASDASVIWPAR
jgi:hypothetical protein